MSNVTIAMHSDGYEDARPAINVKVNGSIRDLNQAGYDLALHVRSLDHLIGLDFGPAWIDAHVSDDDVALWHDEACSWLRDAFEENVAEILGDGVTVEQEGRSGGWLAFAGLAHPLEWDPERVDAWGVLLDLARDYVADVPAETVGLIALNEYAPALEAFEAAEERRNDILAEAVTA